jgi:hypothetical protein
LFVVRGMLLPTAEHDPNPFVAQGAQGRVMRLAGRAEAVITGPRPQGTANRLFREFLDALAQEFGTSPPPMDPMGLAALFGDRGDARQELDFTGQVKTVPIRSE